MRKTLIAGCFAILVWIQCGYAESENPNWFTWSQLSPLTACSTQNESLGVAGPFVGVHNDVLIVAGGANFPKPFEQTQKTWHSDIWVMDKGDSQWQSGFKLDRPVAYGGSVSTRHGLVCIGGNDADCSYDTVFLLQWDSREKKIVRKDLPSLPLPCSHTSAACIGDMIYLAGGQQDTSPISVMHNFWRLDLSRMGQGQAFGWERLPAWLGPARAFNVTVAQHNGMEMCIYVIGGRMQTTEDSTSRVVFNDVYEFSPSKYDASAYDATAGQYNGQGPAANPWRKRADLPLATSAITGIDAGQSHILLFGAAETAEGVPADVATQGFCTTVLAYHTITDTYVAVGHMPTGQVTTTAVKWNEGIILPSGEIRPRVRTPEVWKARWVRQDRHFGWLNFTSLGIYLLATTLFGIYFAKNNKNTDDFFRGGKRIPAWAAGLSIFATMLSSITFVAIPAKVFATDWTFLTINLMSVAIIPILWFYIIPFFMRVDATSAYEFLEKRFGLAVRLFAAVSFVLFQCGRMAIVMYLPSLALSAITGLSVTQSILIMGLLSILYCTMGGFEAVVWTDCIQAIVLIGGALVSLLIVLFSTDGGLSGFISTASANHKYHAINW
ncbi:MAG: sodium:solute symporter, partial [Anaerohalosphaeraceae bacterium]